MDKALGDGYLTSENFDESLLCNCSGRSSRRNFTKEEFIAELLKYDPEDGLWTRNTALERLNVRDTARKYIALYKSCRVKIYLKRLFRS